MVTREYKYPTDEMFTDDIESKLDACKLIRESNLITAMMAYEWKTCLDFGTGTGRHLESLQKANPASSKSHLIAYDIDAERIDAAKSSGGYSERIDFESGALDTLASKVEDSSLDGVLCCQVLGHVSLETFNRIFQFFSRKVKPRGKVVLCIPFYASSTERDFFHVVNIVKARANDASFRQSCSPDEFSTMANAPEPTLLPVRAFGIAPSLPMNADLSSLPLPCSVPATLPSAPYWRAVSAFVYSIHGRLDHQGVAIGDIIVKLERS